MLDQLLDYLNIEELYPPQKEAMQAIERNESLLMSVPTAAGKTVVAYNALMKAVNEGKKGIFLVPLRVFLKVRFTSNLSNLIFFIMSSFRQKK